VTPLKKSIIICKKIIIYFSNELLNIIIPIIFLPIRFLYCKPNVIIIQTYSLFRYGGNPRYLYEYLSDNTEYNVYWVTESKEIKQYLDQKGYKYISSNNIFKKFLVTWSAKIIIDSGSSFYDFYNLISPRAIKICTMHGSGPKLTTFKYQNLAKTISFIKKIHRFDYFSFCTEHAKMMVGKNQFLLHSDKMVTLGAPKCDQFYNEALIINNYSKKKYINSIIQDFDPKGKVIYYIPTYRSYPYKLPILELEGFNEDKFNNFLEKENLYFVYSEHSMSSFTDTLNNNKRIIFFNSNDFPLLDNNQLSMEVDLFIGDYSTLSTDIAIMKKPQLFVIPDYDKLKSTKGFTEDFRSIMPGPEIKSYSNLINNITRYLSNPSFYKKEYVNNINILLERYMNPSIKNSCKLFKDFIDERIK
jgi:CDP-glycerol glycerophosphotransferase